jgi:hypothetical protein
MKKRLKENMGQPTKITPRSHNEMVKYGKGTRWAPAQKSDMGRDMYELYVNNGGNFEIYVSADESVRIAHATVNGVDYYYDKLDNSISEEEAARLLGVDSLDEFDTNDVADFLTDLNLSNENKVNNKKQIKENMSKKKVLRYTEEEFVSLLENIVNRVKKEQRLEENKKASRKKRISENLERIRKERKNSRKPTRKPRN